jgi:hypothetical protein
MTTAMPITNNSKKPYISPRLFAFGNVRSITQSGTMGMAENMGQTGTDRKL